MRHAKFCASAPPPPIPPSITRADITKRVPVVTLHAAGIFRRGQGQQHHKKEFRAWRRAYAEFDRVAEQATWVRLQGVGSKFTLEWTEA